MKANKKVIVKLKGGLGNQMLQYATGLALAKKLDANIYLDTEYFKIDTKRGDTHREFELSLFNIDASITKHFLLSNYIAQMFFLKFSFLRKNILGVFGITYITDSDNIENSNSKNNIIYLDGFWQNSTLFNTYYNNILQAFTLKQTPSGNSEALIKHIKQENAVAVHIRRVDYLLPQSIHYVLDVDFYKKAIAYINEQVSNARFYFFGDDHNWIQSNFDIDNEVNFLVTENTGAFSFMDMIIMSNCKHNIISNSTFSWWSAYLNQFQSKIVVAPLQWFLPNKAPHFSYENFIDDNWIKL